MGKKFKRYIYCFLVPLLAVFCVALLLNENRTNPQGMYLCIGTICFALIGITVVTLLPDKQ